MTIENSTVGKLNKKSSILRIIGLLGILISLVTFVIYTKYQRNRIESQVTLIEQKDSVLTVIKDSAISMTSKQDSLIHWISSFLKTKKDSAACRTFFADTVVNYYGYRNVPVQDIIKTKIDLYKKYPRVKADFSDDNVSISTEKDTVIAYVAMKDYMDSLKSGSFYQRTFKIKLDKNGKVFYITAYREEDGVVRF